MFLKSKSKPITHYYPINEVTSGLIYKYGQRVFYLKSGKGYTFCSQRALDSWKLPVMELDPLEGSLPTALYGVLGFRDGSLIQNFKDGKIYLVSDAKKRLLTAPLEDYGFDWADVVSVSDEEAQFHDDGTDL